MILRCDVSFMVENYSKISLNELQEYKNKFGKDESPFLYGNEPNFENEIAVSDYFLNRYNISKESFKSLIGSNITIYHVSPDGLTQPTLKDVKLTGIIDSRFFTISSRKNTPQVLVTLSEDFPFDIYRIKIFLDSYDSVEEKKRKSRKYVDDVCELRFIQPYNEKKSIYAKKCDFPYIYSYFYSTCNSRSCLCI